jgi:hypothetical protein
MKISAKISPEVAKLVEFTVEKFGRTSQFSCQQIC